MTAGTNAGSSYLQYSKAFNAWTFVSTSNDATTPDAFPAPTLQATATNPAAWKATGKLTIGGVTLGNGNVGDYFNGSISDVRVYQRALTSTDASLLANSAPVEAGAVTTGNAIGNLNRTVYDEPNLRTVIVALGSNDILAGKSATEIESNFTALLGPNDARGLANYRRADGGVLHRILTTVPPLGLDPNDAREKARRQLNSDIISRSGNYFADGLLDFDAAVRDGAHANNINPQYLTNNVPNDAYYEKLAQTLADAVNDLPPDATL
ncbi:LamG-like jellyroll fold domain-containing protein [Kutzneria sp. NPDC052558]|uniref:LamG-like jellyroll fold domain-containing protein n=1 Tax=Kutzneria sp. NPDC052558 TaxID=3364121 RepID=UPI0037C5A6F2